MSSKFLDQSVVNREANIRVYNERIDNTLTIAGGIAQPNNTIQQGNTETPPIHTAVTLNSPYGIIETQHTTTTPAGIDGFILYNSLIKSNTVVLGQIFYYSGPLDGTKGVPILQTIVTAAGECVFTIINQNPTNPLNGTVKIYFELREQI